MVEARSDPPLEGTARYEVLEALGEGGMGAVYRVLDTRLGREVALKRLHQERRGRRTVTELFEREYHALSELAHPRIIEVYDYGVDDEGAFYTMELLGGSDLRQLERQHWKEACRLLRDVASSLAIIHARRLVHCDLTPRNVRCTADGRAKLLDFGAMVPMGPPRRIVGTPPFVSPEMVQQQSLDGRSDIFSFGALAYWLLTGRHAFPARNFVDLRQLWASPLPAPREVIDEIPQALSELVMDCLSINADARPRSASVVMERLCGIAGLPLEEHPDVAVAYLTTPGLCGRTEQLTRVREVLVSCLRGSGHVFCARGGPGSGRTRFLEASMLEGKLQGATVLRVMPEDAGRGELAALASICAQLFELMPEAARRAARVHGEALAHLPGAPGAERSRAQPPPRRQLLAAVRDFILAATRRVRLVIAVDDTERVDEGSISVLLALAQKARRRPMCLIFAIDASSVLEGPLVLLEELAEPIELLPLVQGETEKLIDSLFGSVPNTLTVARRIHEVAGGNPRAIMQLATQLVERGVVRYEAGSFLLPEQLSDADLPRSLADALRARLRGLPPDALELLQALSLTEPIELSPGDYGCLLTDGDRARAFRALDQLVAAVLLAPQGERYRLADPTLRAVVPAELSEERERELHARLASAFEARGSITRRGFHLMGAGQHEAAIRVLLAKYLADPQEPRDPLEDYVPGLLDLLERASVAARELPLSPDIKTELTMKTCGASQFLADIERFRRLAPPLREQLERDSGLRDFDDVPEDLPPMERLTRALTAVQQRHDATPEEERGLAPVDAVRELSRMCAMYSGIAAAAQDTELLKERPSLEPLAPLSPAIECIERFGQASSQLMQGRSELARQGLRSLIERLGEPDLGGLGALYHRSMLLGSRYIVGLIEAATGLPDAGRVVASLEHEPGHRVNAQRVHQICHMLQGRPGEARACARRAELAILQDGHPQRYFGTTARSELLVHALLDDLMEVKRLTDRMAQVSERYPGWTVGYHVGRYHYLRIQGDAEGALAALLPSVEVARPLEHRDWPMLAAAHVRALTEVGRVDEAVALGRGHVQTCGELELNPGHRGVIQATAAAELERGEHAEAQRMMDGLIEEARSAGVRGLILGAMHELSAAIAVAQGDQAGFEEHNLRCVQEYGAQAPPGLLRRHRKLLERARRFRGAPQRSFEQAISTMTTRGGVTTSEANSRLQECSSEDARAACAVRILLEEVSASRGYLFGMRAGELQLLASVPDEPVPQALQESAAECFQQAAELGGGTTLSVAIDHTSTVGPTQTAYEAGVHRVFPLISAEDGEAELAAVAAFVCNGSEHAMPAPELLKLLAESLLGSDDLDPTTIIDLP